MAPGTKTRKNSRPALGSHREVVALFLRGSYNELLGANYDRLASSVSPKAIWAVVGALCFKGRLEEAALLYENAQAKLDITQQIQCRFFLGISYTRIGLYARGRSFLGANLRALGCRAARKISGQSERSFFVYQGLGFYRYFCGRLRAAERLSLKSFRAAIAADFLYGRVLSADLRGHVCVQRGEVATGLEILDQAAQLALQLGNGAVPESIRTSSVLYEAQHGLDADKIVAKLLGKLESTRAQDSYTEASLLLELIRQHLLRGNIEEARRLSGRAAQLIYATQNRRHEIVLNLRLAYLAYVTGENAQALVFLRSGKKTLDLDVDQMFEVELLGLELKALRRLKMEALRAPLEHWLKQKSRYFGGNVNARILAREGIRHAPVARTGLDPLGDLCDTLRNAPTEDAVEAVLSSGYFGFLVEVLGLSPAASLLYLDLKASAIVVFAAGSVQVREGLSTQSRKILIEISRGSCSKARLVEKIWGYEYHPLRHDAIVYSAITSLRKLLGEYGDWIVNTEDGYALAAGIEMRTASPSVSAAPAGAAFSAPALRDDMLNFRQMKILRYLKKNESIDVRRLVELFDVSEITASRDLRHLREKKLFAKNRTGSLDSVRVARYA